MPLLISCYNRKQNRSRPCPQGARETHRQTRKYCVFHGKKKKKSSMEKTQVKKNGEQQRVVVAILNTVVRFWQFVILFVFLSTI